ncbi:MAG: leucine-rich repeat protein [Ruminococcus sp.]
MKKLIAGVLACTMICGAVPYINHSIPENYTINANAEDYTVGIFENLTYNICSDHIEILSCDESATEVTIPSEIDGLPVTTIGGLAFYDCSELKSISIPETITEIGYVAFRNCSGLTELTIPDSVTKIEEEAFLGCSGLTKITVGKNNPNYADVDGILFNKDFSEIILYPAKKENTSYIIPDSVTNIREYTFDSCKNLTSITIPDSVTSIKAGAFQNCSGLTSITIPDSVTTIGIGTFSGCSGLKSATIGKNLTTIENFAFLHCSGLTEINIPDSVTSIGDYVFASCSSLTSIKIPESVTNIGSRTFMGCSGLTEITIPKSVTNIGNAAFSDCMNLTGVTVDKNNSNYADIDGTLFNKDFSALLFHPFKEKETSYIIPDSVKIIGSEAFSNCSNLTEITVPKSVTKIERAAFYCPKLNQLKSIKILNPNCEFYDFSSTISYTATIYGYENSTAQAYAEKYERNFVILGEEQTTDSPEKLSGDCNLDGNIDIADVVSVSAYVGDSKNNPLSEQSILNADVHNTGDGLTANDALMIQQYLSGNITTLE